MFMNIQENQIEVNDYLDLYLYAKNIGDKPWQAEIIEKLKIIVNENPKSRLHSLTELLEKYKRLNGEILGIYQQMKHQSSNINLDVKIQQLKKQRILLGRQIELTKGHSAK
jgi:hypothetical protein